MGLPDFSRLGAPPLASSLLILTSKGYAWMLARCTTDKGTLTPNIKKCTTTGRMKMIRNQIGNAIGISTEAFVKQKANLQNN